MLYGMYIYYIPRQLHIALAWKRRYYYYNIIPKLLWSVSVNRGTQAISIVRCPYIIIYLLGSVRYNNCLHNRQRYTKLGVDGHNSEWYMLIWKANNSGLTWGAECLHAYWYLSHIYTNNFPSHTYLWSWYRRRGNRVALPTEISATSIPRAGCVPHNSVTTRTLLACLYECFNLPRCGWKNDDFST